MKKLFLLIAVLSVSAFTMAQNTHYPYYHQRVTLFDELPTSPNDIIFLGNSITNGAEWVELFNNINVKNRGINGDTALGVYDRLDQIIKGKPSKIFLLIGINDVSQGISPDTIVSRIERITRKIKTETPRTRLYIQSVLPVTEEKAISSGHSSRWALVPIINKQLKAIAEKEKVTYIDLFSHLKEKDSDKLDIKYSNDGLHLMGNGYLKWVEVIRPYVED